MALHPADPDVLFVSNLLSDSVAVVDLAEGEVIATIPVPEPDETPTAPGFFVGTPVQKLLSYVARASVTVRPEPLPPHWSG